VVRVPGYRSSDPGFDSQRYQIFWEVMCLENIPASPLAAPFIFSLSLITFYACIPEVLGSHSVRHTGYSDIFRGFSESLLEVTGYYPDYATTVSF
jgi:hypothetical protein